MRWFRFAALILLAAVLQADLVDVIAVTTLGIKPDLLLILLVFFAIHYGTKETIITSFTIGLAADLINVGSAMGLRTISFGLIGSSLAYLHTVITVRKMPHQSLVIFITGLLTGALICFLAFLKSQEIASNIYASTLGNSLYSAIVGPFLFLPVAWWMRLKTRRLRRY